MKYFTFLLLLVSALRCEWLTDVDEAGRLAQSKNRYLFIFFTGSDWCGWCKRLKQEVLDTDEFLKYANENFVLAEIDFPQNKVLPRNVVQYNQQLAQLFQVKGYPTIFVLDKFGKLVVRTGYREGGAEAYIKFLRSSINSYLPPATVENSSAAQATKVKYDPREYFDRAEGYEKKENFQKAYLYFQRVAEIDPKGKLGSKAKERMKKLEDKLDKSKMLLNK